MMASDPAYEGLFKQTTYNIVDTVNKGLTSMSAALTESTSANIDAQVAQITATLGVTTGSGLNPVIATPNFESAAYTKGLANLNRGTTVDVGPLSCDPNSAIQQAEPARSSLAPLTAGDYLAADANRAAWDARTANPFGAVANSFEVNYGATLRNGADLLDKTMLGVSMVGIASPVLLSVETTQAAIALGVNMANAAQTGYTAAKVAYGSAMVAAASPNVYPWIKNGIDFINSWNPAGTGVYPPDVSIGRMTAYGVKLGVKATEKVDSLGRKE
jgi:hypothetical protein